MTAQIIDGKDLQQPILDRIAAALLETGLTPVLDLITIEHPVPEIRMQTDPAFDLHVSFLGGQGIEVRPHRLPETTTNEELLALVERLNEDEGCDGIFLLVPPPDQIDLALVINTIDPAKELEGLHPRHAARLLPVSLTPPVRPMVVPETLRTLFAAVGQDFTDAHVVVLVEHGALRQNLITHMVAKFGSGLIWPADTTLTMVAHDAPRVAEISREADVLITVLPGLPRLVRGSWVKPGATVVDFAPTVVGTELNAAGDRKVPVFAGGVDNDEVSQVAKILVPAPRGIGPVLLSLLAENVTLAAIARRGPKA